MKTLARLLASDLRYGIGAIARRLVLVLITAAIVFFLSYVVILIKLPELEHVTLGECLLCIWRGMLPYSPELGEPFQFPMAWFALLVAIAYAVCDYPFRDLDGMGARLIVACRSRWAWWLAKCGWVVAVALVCWLAPFLVALAVTLFFDGDMSLLVRPATVSVLSAGRNAAVSEATQLLASGSMLQAVSAAASLDLTGPLLSGLASLAAILLVQTVVALLVHPVVGMAASISVLFFSAYFRVWWLPGEYLMLARSDVLMRAGMHPETGLALAACIALAAVVCGGLVFNRKDII